MFINQYPQIEFIYDQQSRDYQQQEDFSFFDFKDQSKVKCYFPDKNRRPQMKFPKTEWATQKQDKQKILNQIINDINITTPEIQITPKSIKFLDDKFQSKYAQDQFIEQQIVLFDENNKQYSQKQVKQMADEGKLSAQSFTKSRIQKSKDQYARKLDIQKIEDEQNIKINKTKQYPIPRLFYYRDQSNKQNHEYQKNRMIDNMENYIPIGKFNENSTIYATCLPSQDKNKEKCELLKIDIQKYSNDNFDQSKIKTQQLDVYLGCSRLCKFKDMAEQFYQQFDKDYIVCNK